MAFRTIEKGNGRGSKRLVNSVSIRHTPTQIAFTISEDLYRQIGSPSALNVAVGTGTDAGKFRLIPHPDGYRVREAGPKSTAKVIAVGRGLLNIPATLKPVVTAHRMADDGLEVSVTFQLREESPRAGMNTHAAAAA